MKRQQDGPLWLGSVAMNIYQPYFDEGKEKMKYYDMV